MTGLFEYPKSAAVGRVVPKNKIYEVTGASASLKDLFVREVDKIVWQYKLAPETINLNATKSVIEIHVFGISLKTETLNEAVLVAIDKAIPLPLIFELIHNGKRKVIAAYKRPNAADEKKSVVSEYFATDWLVADTTRLPLPVALNLGALYNELLSALMPRKFDNTVELSKRVERVEAIRAKTREVERIAVKLAREKQFNKRVSINADLRIAKVELERLTGLPFSKPHNE